MLLDDVDGGTPQRFLWFPVLDENAPTEAPPEPEVLTWTAPSLSGRVSWRGCYMDVCETARDTIDHNRLARLRGDGDALDGHALLTQLKTAAALALAADRLHITDSDWHLAAAITRKSASVRRSVVTALENKTRQANAARADAEANRAIHVEHAKEENAIRSACGTLRRRLARLDPDNWATRSDLRRALASKDRQHFDAAIERLIATGDIQLDTTTTGHGNDTGRYRLKERS